MESCDSQLLAASRESWRKKKKKKQESKESNVCSRADLSLSFLRKYIVYITHDSVASNSSLHLNSQIILRVHFFFILLLFAIYDLKPLVALADGRRTVRRDSRAVLFSPLYHVQCATRAL